MTQHDLFIITYGPKLEWWVQKTNTRVLLKLGRNYILNAFSFCLAKWHALIYSKVILISPGHSFTHSFNQLQQSMILKRGVREVNVGLKGNSLENLKVWISNCNC